MDNTNVLTYISKQLATIIKSN